MKLKIFLFALLGVIATAQAQNTGNVSGKITEKANGAPISYATVSLKENGKVVSGVNTDDNGDFSFKNIALKSYTIEIQYIGFRKYVGSVLLSENKKSATVNVSLEEEATQLKGVNIVAERSTIEQKIDRKVVTVGKDLTTAGASASDIMNNIPSVNVDQDGKLSLRGNDNVRVLIDGRPSNIDPAQLLKQIPSTSIKKIELITNPSAKYNPEGMSGIINIILHKNANTGFNGTYSGGITFGETAKYNQSLDLNYKTGKVNFFGNAGNNFGTYFNDGHIQRLDQDVVQKLDISNDNDNYLYKVGMDYLINDHNTLSFYTNQNKSTGTGIVNTDIDYNNGDPDIKNIYQKSRYQGPNETGTYNLAYKHIFKKEGHTLDFEGNYSRTIETQNANFDTQTTTPANAISNTVYNDYIHESRKLGTFNVDYVNPLNEKTTLEAGAEARITRTDNIYNTTNPAFTPSTYTYDTDIYSAYVTFGQKYKKFSYQLGARFESYNVKSFLDPGQKKFDDDYITLYPSAYLTYNLNEKNVLQLSYSRRVDRPSLEQTKPIREFSTPLVTSYGNQELRPQFTNSVEVNYTKTLEKGSITAGVFVRAINDQISRTLRPDPDDPSEKQILGFTNFDHNTAYGFDVSLNYKITKWWDIQPAIDFSSIKQQGVVFEYDPATNLSTPLERHVTTSAFNARMNSNFKPTKRLSFLLFGFFRGPVDEIQQKRNEMYKIDIGSRYTLLDNKMNISVRFNDVFNTMKFSFDGIYPYPQTGQFTWESQTVYLGLTYNFGGGKIKNLQRKQRDDNTNKDGGGMF
ncbi:outer membrane receptor protein involved in Fe transport [Flavobacterium nitrogenifigens]|uniref:Outer membrane receptor protein involved in Fe transport n=2 Tax=Flavobacterium TaxID=237 RepID=A0A7W7J165_9FLAO|nr:MULTISPECIES: outer membrane beta-barrel family protein [Flavobacterium]MBB4803595.1 outer membrane receptor protein involved in Fe transport [Flavobacterium nitrogenifigens]MBB6388600.1 outer membrane receptor protein involved in Fe transport [Flavobacterium notoginsengisoli]